MDALLISAIGTALSAFIAAMGYLAKTRHERRRSTRTVLYYLLETHHLVLRLQFGLKHVPKELISRSREALREQSVVLTDADASIILKHLPPLLRELAVGELQALGASIQVPFEQALADLSREDPVLAFKLRGRDQVALLTNRLEPTLTRYAEALGSGGQTGSSPIGAAVTEDLVRGLAVTELESAIRSTAWRCDLLTHFLVLRLLRHAKRQERLDDLKQLVSEMVDSLLPILVVMPPKPAQP